MDYHSTEFRNESSNRNENGFVKSFPEKLMELLSCKELSNSIAWTPMGDAFVIKNESMFEKNVLRKLYKNTKYCSFKGKLYRWGFRRVRKGKLQHKCDAAYFHKLFLRDNPRLCLHMRRNISPKVKDTRKNMRIFSGPSDMHDSMLTKKNTAPTNGESSKQSSASYLLPAIQPDQKSSSESFSMYNNQINHALLRNRFPEELLLKHATIRAQIRTQLLRQRL